MLLHVILPSALWGRHHYPINRGDTLAGVGFTLTPTPWVMVRDQLGPLSAERVGQCFSNVSHSWPNSQTSDLVPLLLVVGPESPCLSFLTCKLGGPLPIACKD